ncbi:hypothetical protein QYF36_021266 [Acer negundo]|nr:hypothetical protein QYF36_021266 [Acer negundo]
MAVVVSELCLGVRLRLMISAVLIGLLFVSSMSVVVSAEPSLKPEAKLAQNYEKEEVQINQLMKFSSTPKIRSRYVHVWPDMKISWEIVVGMITGTAIATVFYNLRQRHPTLELPVIDYDLALLMQPMLVLGISIGVAFNVIFADWMITVLLIILFIVMSTKSFFKGVETWKKETITIKEAANRSQLNGNGSQVEEFKCEPESLNNPTAKETQQPKRPKVSLLENVYWKELGILVLVWVAILALQIAKNFAATCSALYWLLNALQIPVAGGVASATSTFAMAFSSSLSVVEYYLLKRFPVPYALYFFAVATVAAFAGQYVVKKLIKLLGRASLIIFVLSFTIIISAFLLGGVGLAKMIDRIHRKEYMGFDNICSY